MRWSVSKIENCESINYFLTFSVGAIDGALDGSRLGCTDGGLVGVGVGLEVVGAVVPLQEPTIFQPSSHKPVVDPGSYPKVPHE